MVVNFRIRGISRDARKLTRTLMLIKKNIIVLILKKYYLDFFKIRPYFLLIIRVVLNMVNQLNYIEKTSTRANLKLELD